MSLSVLRRAANKSASEMQSYRENKLLVGIEI